jgi:large subunit ribosomal protein L29
MAEKTTKTTAPKAAELTNEQQLAAKRSDLLEARKSLAAGELVNPSVISRLRKDIARLLTTINAQKEAK